MAQYVCICVGGYWFSAMLISKWPPGGHVGYFQFLDSNFSLALNINSKLKWHNTYIHGWPGSLVAILDFSGFWTVWFRQCNSSLLWIFSLKFHVHVPCGCRQKPNDCQLCRFQSGCLVILNNVQLQSTHCPLPPSPMGRGYPSRSLIYNF